MLIRTQAGVYELVEEGRDGWNPEAFKERYSDILDKYDYIVGDWGYSQLRLRGFYENTNKKVPFEQKIATLDEYLQEFCNFGCAYFVLKRVRSFGHEQTPHDETEEDQVQEVREESSADPFAQFNRRQNPRLDKSGKNNRPSRQERQDRPAKEQGNHSLERSDRLQRPHRNESKERPDKAQRIDRPHKERRNAQFANRSNREKVSSEVVLQTSQRAEEKK